MYQIFVIEKYHIQPHIYGYQYSTLSKKRIDVCCSMFWKISHGWLSDNHGFLLRLEFWILKSWENISFVCTMVCISPMSTWNFLPCYFQLILLSFLFLGVWHTQIGTLRSIHVCLWKCHIAWNNFHDFLIIHIQPCFPYPFCTECRNQKPGFRSPFFVVLMRDFSRLGNTLVCSDLFWW